MCFFIQNHKHGSPDKYEHKNSESDDEILDGIDPVEICKKSQIFLKI